jgi:hypothetical protein
MIRAGVVDDAVALSGALRSAGARALADRIDALGRGAAALAVRDTALHVAALLGAVARRQPADVGAALSQWLPQLRLHTASAAVEQLAAAARELLASPAFVDARRRAPGAARRAGLALEAVAALAPQAVALRRFEEAASTRVFGRSGAWLSIGAELLSGLQ